MATLSKAAVGQPLNDKAIEKYKRYESAMHTLMNGPQTNSEDQQTDQTRLWVSKHINMIIINLMTVFTAINNHSLFTYA